MSATPMLAAVVDLDSPGRYLHWSIFTVSLANLALIVVMVVIFAAALLVPFPRSPARVPTPPDEDVAARELAALDGAGERPRMWTARLRRYGLRVLPPRKLLPDTQPA